MELIKKKHQKTMKIISVISEFKDLSKSRVLDIGCGTGLIAKNLREYCKEIVGVDVEDKRLTKEGYKFKLVKDEKLPFKDKTFDVVISNQVIEHVKNQDKHLKEIKRVLKNNGICYLATPNKYWPLEPHYYLPFLGAFPSKFSNFYLRIFKNKDYDVRLFSHNKLIRQLNKYFKIYDFTFTVMKNSRKYHLEKKFKIVPSFLIKGMPWSILKFLVPSFILILKKKN